MPLLSNRQKYEDFTDYLATVIDNVSKLNQERYLQIREGLDEVIYELYFREVTDTDATKFIEIVITNMGRYLFKNQH